MPVFTSLVDMRKHIEMEVEVALNRVTDKVFNKLYKFIEEEIYIKKTLKFGHESDSTYEQTGDFLNALRKSKAIRAGKAYVTIIDFDSGTMEQVFRENTLFNAHLCLNGDSSWKGKSVPDWLPSFLDEGIESEAYTHDGIEFSKFIETYLNTNFNREMKKELRALGLKGR